MVLNNLSERESLKLMALEYDVEDTGNFLSEAILQLFCRDGDGNRRLVEVEGFYPFFYISEQEYVDNQHDLFQETMVREIEAREGITSKNNSDNAALSAREDAPRVTLDGQKLVKIYTVIPKHVGELREHFDKTWEADVFFTDRFLVESGIKRGFTIPQGKDRVQYHEIEVTDNPPNVSPRVCTIDIEVWSGGTFPDTQNTTKPITSVTVHDSYDNEYLAGILEPPKGDDRWDEHSWDNELDWELPDNVDDGNIEIETFENEGKMLAWVNEWIIEKDPDLMTGWNSSRNDIGSGFDYPYWINRCERINEWTYKDLSPTDNVFVSRRGSPVMGGREMFDMLQAYKKTQIHEKRSYSLGYIAEDELGYGKEDIADLDEGWLHNPVEFLKYNIRDVEAVVEIEKEKSVLDMYDHIRSITGGDYSEIADSNIGIIDLLFLRQAGNKGLALPTSVRPDVQHYWGAYVFPPVPGKHEHVVYPDLSSLYPNLFRDMNASPETIIGFQEDLEASEYSEEDCHTVYVDTRDESTKKNVDEPERTPLYVLKPEVKESFVRETIQDLIDMKYEYKKDEYSDEAYEAVKRITNSVYGVMGDSVSYGRGFRLFDWRIAEAITLAGRDVIKHTADTFEERVQKAGYPKANTVAGDTDSCVLSMKGSSSMDETLEVAHDAAEYVDMTYEEFMNDRFGIVDGNMAVEIESYAEAALFMTKKKRYAQLIKWDEGDLEDEIEYKGFELVRSDSAPITMETQKKVIEIILRNDNPKPLIREYLKDQWDHVADGEVDPHDVAKPSKINNPLWDYGWSINEVEDEPETDINGEKIPVGDDFIKYYTPQPHIRGTRYANAYVDGEDISQGDKPQFLYVDHVEPRNGFSETYDYENQLNDPGDDVQTVTKRGMYEEDRKVDGIALTDFRNLPDEVHVDWEKMAEKTIRDPIEPIIDVMGWNFDDLITEGRQSGLENFM